MVSASRLLTPFLAAFLAVACGPPANNGGLDSDCPQGWTCDDDGVCDGPSDVSGVSLVNGVGFTFETRYDLGEAHLLEAGEQILIVGNLEGNPQCPAVPGERHIHGADIEVGGRDQLYNLRVDAFVVTSRRDDVLRVQRGALGQSAVEQVFVVRDGKVVRVPVRWGAIGEENIEVAGGLAEGDEIVISDMNDYEGLKEMRLR